VGVAFRSFAANGFYHLLAWQLFFNRNSDDTLLISSLHMMKSFFAEFSYNLQNKFSQGKPGEEGDRI